MSRGALLTGTVGGIIGAITAAFGIVWIFITYAFLAEMDNYLRHWTYYLNPIPLPGMYEWFPTFPPLYYPSTSLLVASSSILAILLIVTGILIGVGFYGAYKIGGGAMSVVGLIFSIIGITLGALLIIVGNLTTGYMYAYVEFELAVYPFLPIPTPNFNFIWIGFAVLGFTLILLGSASIAVRETTGNPSASTAVGILNIIGAVFFIIGGIIYYPIFIVGFILIFVAFILWAVVFYSSRYM